MSFYAIRENKFSLKILIYSTYLLLSVHAAIIAINEAIESQVTSDIMTALGNPAAMLLGLTDDLGDNYAQHLYEAKQTKAKNAKNKVKFKISLHIEGLSDSVVEWIESSLVCLLLVLPTETSKHPQMTEKLFTGM